MKKVVKVKASRRNGKTVKAHTRTISGGVNSAKEGKEFRKIALNKGEKSTLTPRQQAINELCDMKNMLAVLTTEIAWRKKTAPYPENLNPFLHAKKKLKAEFNKVRAEHAIKTHEIRRQK